jgi:hypothetical protein
LKSDINIYKIKMEDYQMDILRKIFPYSFKKNDSIANLVIGIIVYLVIGIVAGLIMGLAGAITDWIPVVGTLVGIVLRIVGAIVDLYVIGGIVVKILSYLKVI